MKKQTTKENNNLQEIYKGKGYRMLNRSDISGRFFSFMIDTIVMLAPIMIWNIIMMTVLGSIVSISGIILVNIVIGVLLLVTMLGLNTYIYIQTGGQSLGKRICGFKVVRKNGKDATKGQLMIREMLGFNIPFIVLMFFLNIFGVALFWILNGLLILVDKRQRTLIDFMLNIRVVALIEKERVPLQEKQVTPVKTVANPHVCHLDLHIHSNFSVNGEYNIEEIFQRAAKRGMKTISITDLDCAKSNNIAMRMSKLYHVNYVPGIEINCELDGTRIRILAYFIDYNSELYATIENESLIHEKNASIERVQKFERIIGRRIDIDRLLGSNRFMKIPGELIAKHVLSRPEYQDCESLQAYIRMDDHDRACHQMAKDFFAYGKPCYVSVTYPLLEDVLDVIEMTNGVPVLAYPGKLLAYEPKLVDKAIFMGVQGIEVFHPSHSKREMADLLRYALGHKLFVTGGSGYFHSKGGVEIGNFNCPKDAEGIINDFINTKLS